MIRTEDFVTTRPESPATTEFKRHTMWKSCCFTLDSRSVMFFSQLLISIIVMLFSITMLFYSYGNCEAQNVYIALLSSIIGIWLPHPRIE